MKPKPTVSILIPAYNEAANIGYLLDDLKNQQLTNVTLDRIIVNSDGSKDETISIVRSREIKKLTLIENTNNKGQPYRQNELLAMCQSDIAILLNADVKIEDKKFIEKLSMPIVNSTADLTSCPLIESEPTTFTEKVLCASMKVKSRIFEHLNNGDNVYTCHGTARALSRRLYKQMRFKEGPGEDAYSYLYTLSKGLKYSYTKTTKLKYRLSNNFTDYRVQNLRFIESQKNMERHFGKDLVRQQYKIPLRLIIHYSLGFLLRHPILSFLYVVIYGVNFVSSFFSKTPNNNVLAKSSKIVRIV